VLVAGCNGKPKVEERPAASFAGIALKVGALDDLPILSSVARERGEWEASRGGGLSIVEERLSLDSLSTIDVVIFRAQRLGDLVDKSLLAAIPVESLLPPNPSGLEHGEDGGVTANLQPSAAEDTLRYLDFAPAFREQVSRYGKDQLALPLGSSALVLAYRRDAFESDANREAMRREGLALPPKTWEQLDALAKFFQGRDWNGDGRPDHGIAVALGPEIGGIGDLVFLARAASLGQHPDHYSFLFDSDKMTPRIDTPPFALALKGVVGWQALGPPGMERFDAAAARASFRAGHVAMLVDFAERAFDWCGGKPAGVLPLPGADRVYEPIQKVWKPAAPLNSPSYLPHGGGWLVGISSRLSGKEFEAALDFAMYLANPENSNRIGAERAFPMLPVRDSQMDSGLLDPTSAPDVDWRLWSVAVKKTLSTERVIAGLRIPGADDYLSDLSKARMAAIAGEPPEKALNAVAKAWNERTAARGPKRQLRHYRRSLNNLITLPEPPEPGK
jgi:multiple sugar transport system substrate-binding protein